MCQEDTRSGRVFIAVACVYRLKVVGECVFVSAVGLLENVQLNLNLLSLKNAQ